MTIRKRLYLTLTPNEKGGVLEIETIDLNDVLKYRDEDHLLIPLFGVGSFAGHRWAWTSDALVKLMEKAGFTHFVHSRGRIPKRDFVVKATK